MLQLCRALRFAFHNANAELGRDALTAEGYHVLGGYMSPVNDLYNKKVPLSSGLFAL